MNKNSYLLIIAVILMIVMLLNILTPIMGSEITSILTSITTITGIFSVFIEMKRSADIAECEFIYYLQKQFDDNPSIQACYKIMDDDYADEKEPSDIKRKEIVAYLTFFEMTCNLLLKNVIQIDDIDALFGYPFFLAMNHKTIQDKELIKYKQYYQNIHTVYPKWLKYRENKGYEIPNKDNIIK